MRDATPVAPQSVTADGGQQDLIEPLDDHHRGDANASGGIDNGADVNNDDREDDADQGEFEDLEEEFSKASSCIFFAQYSEEYDQYLAQPAREPLIDINVANTKKKQRDAYRDWPQLNLDLASEFVVLGLLLGHAFPSAEKLREAAEDAIIYARREQVAIACNQGSSALKGMFCE